MKSFFPKRTVGVSLLIVTALVTPGVDCLGESPSKPPELPGPREVVSRFLEALVAGDPEAAASQLDERVFLFNGANQPAPTQWQAHLDVEGESWPAALLEEAGPIRSQHHILSSHQRGTAALVVTTETGSNRFREYRDETVVYQLRQRPGGWRICGFFYPSLSNPE